jgi:hypothetical protein
VSMDTEQGSVAGCPSYPSCGHDLTCHAVEDDWAPLPICTAPGCGCGRPPAGYRRMIDQRVFDRAAVVPAGVAVLDEGGRFYPAEERAWFNVGCGPLVEVEPEVEGRRSAVRSDVDRAYQALSGVGLSLSMWSGRGNWVTSSPASRDLAGRRALHDLDAVIKQLGAAREELACATDPRLSGQVSGPRDGVGRPAAALDAE